MKDVEDVDRKVGGNDVGFHACFGLQINIENTLFWVYILGLGYKIYAVLDRKFMSEVKSSLAMIN